MLDGSEPIFVAGNRKAEGLSVTGNQIHIVNTPPELSVTLGGGDEAREKTVLHHVTLEAGSTESIKLNGMTYHQLPDTTLVGVNNVVLSVEQDGANLLAGTEKGVGVVDLPAGTIRFTDLDVEISASTTAEVFVLADVDLTPRRALRLTQAPTESHLHSPPFIGNGSSMRNVVFPTQRLRSRSQRRRRSLSTRIRPSWRRRMVTS